MLTKKKLYRQVEAIAESYIRDLKYEDELLKEIDEKDKEIDRLDDLITELDIQVCELMEENYNLQCELDRLKEAIEACNPQ